MEYKQRKNIRLKEYDYSTNGAYFVTICTKCKRHILSTIRVGGAHTPSANVSPHSGRRPCRRILDAPYIELTEKGEIVREQFEIMNHLYEDINVKHYVIMPNHIHFIIEIKKSGGTSGRPSPTRSNSALSKYVGTFKRFTDKKCGDDIWQRSYYDHIIRNEADFIEKQNYIINNPAKWLEDEYFNEG